MGGALARRACGHAANLPSGSAAAANAEATGQRGAGSARARTLGGEVSLAKSHRRLALKLLASDHLRLERANLGRERQLLHRPRRRRQRAREQRLARREHGEAAQALEARAARLGRGEASNVDA